jgi:3-hydroxy-9,10-secoandrosta-1,3,5(10)-triene-9,17-dione monooxygenase reductase component
VSASESISKDALKDAFSRWATGVTIVTARSGDRILGMTVSAFTEVSLEPPLVLVCADKTSNTHPLIAESQAFAVHILRRGQEKLSNLFASKKDEHRRFDGLEHKSGATGAPLLPGTLATFDCRVRNAHDAGDHIIYVGEVVDLRLGELDDSASGGPLMFYGREYRSLTE